MPELPEIETIRRNLQPLLREQTICYFHRYHNKLRYPIPDLNFTAGCQVSQLSRRSKYLIIALSRRGQYEGRLLLHLGMSGALYFLPKLRPNERHDQWCLEFNRGVLLYRDPRRFGRLSWYATGEDHELEQLLGRIGPEPLGPAFTARQLFTASRGRRQSVKVWLLAGRAVCGVGNIYSCEALSLAGVDPFKPASALSKGECVHLSMAIRSVLQRAICAGGTTLRDFSNVDGRPGYFQQQLRVYGREQQRCCRCQGRIERQVQGGRSTFFCRQCQGGDGHSLFAPGAK